LPVLKGVIRYEDVDKYSLEELKEMVIAINEFERRERNRWRDIFWSKK